MFFGGFRFFLGMMFRFEGGGPMFFVRGRWLVFAVV